MGTGLLISPYTCAHVKNITGKPATICSHPTWSEKMNSTILALDLGTHTGWALHQLDHTHDHQWHQIFKPQRFEGGGMHFLRFKRSLNELLTVGQHINTVYF